MDRETATTEARRVAHEEGIRMAVTRNPYAETPAEEWGYMPVKAAERIFTHEEVVEVIEPDAN